MYNTLSSKDGLFDGGQIDAMARTRHVSTKRPINGFILPLTSRDKELKFYARRRSQGFLNTIAGIALSVPLFNQHDYLIELSPPSWGLGTEWYRPRREPGVSLPSEAMSRKLVSPSHTTRSTTRTAIKITDIIARLSICSAI